LELFFFLFLDIQVWKSRFSVSLKTLSVVAVSRHPRTCFLPGSLGLVLPLKALIFCWGQNLIMLWVSYVKFISIDGDKKLG
jgi:hypothetical protein